MRLYATTTSERASKGQGGNRFLDIDIFTTNKEKSTHHVHVIVSPNGNQIVVSLSSLHFGVAKLLASDTIFLDTPIKGEKQKGEKVRCNHCNHMHIETEENQIFKCAKCGKDDALMTF